MQSIKAQKPLIKCLTFFGFFSFNFDATLSSDWKLKLYCIIVNVCSLVQFVFNSLCYIETSNEHLGDSSRVTFMCHILEAIANQVNMWIIVYSILWTRDEQIKFLKLLESIESDVNSLSFSDRVNEDFYRSLRVNTVSSTIGSLVFYVSLVCFFIFFLMQDESLSHHFQALNYSVFTLYYVYLATFILNLVMTIRNFFELMNTNLRAFIERSDFYQKEIRFLLVLHQELSFLIHTFNSSFGVILLGSFVCLSGSAAIEAYFNYITIITGLIGKKHHILYCIANIVWLGPMFLVLQRLGSTCSKVQETIEDTSKIFRSFNLQSEKLIDKCLQNSIQNDTKFTANGLFVIDNSMIYKVARHLKLDPCLFIEFTSQIVITTVTFLVIAIQFHQLEQLNHPRADGYAT